MPILSGNKQLQAAQLDNLGSTDRGDKVTLSNSAQVLVKMADYLITEAQKNLDRKGSVATGELESSIKAKDIEIDGSKLSLDIELLDRYKFINDGVKGTEGGTGKYQFKTNRPSKGMQKSIKAWLRLRGRRAMKYKAISKTERKDQGIARTRAKADSQESLAWAVATSIKKNGIKPTKFFTNAVRATEKEFKKELAAGFRLDIIESLKDGNSNQ